MALSREALGRARAIPAGAASLGQEQASRAVLGSEQPLACDGSAGVSCFAGSRDPSPGSGSQGSGAAVLLGEGWAVWGGLALEGSIVPSSWCCSSG